MVDLRSDTFTQPTPAMREAMAQAPVGDDVFGEDPTLNRLQEEVASLLGKEAALFVPSGTMGNQIALHVQSRPGQEIIVDENAHIFYYEAGAPALLSGVQTRTVAGKGGVMTAQQVEAAVRADNLHFPPTALICLENTLNRGSGRVYPLEEILRIREVADRHGVPMHLDGARLWNAAVATGVDLATWAAPFDSLNLCFSKGLGAPVGSIVVGSQALIDRARRARKILGGAMRQAGIIGAGALYALHHHIDRLADDHRRARRLAEAVNKLDGLSIDLDAVETNIVIMTVTRPGLSAREIARDLKAQGVLLLDLGPAMLRAVTHLGVDDAGIDQAIEGFKQVLSRS